METLPGEDEQGPVVIIRNMVLDDLYRGFLDTFAGWKPTGLTIDEACRVFATREHHSGLLYTAVAIVLPDGEVAGTATMLVEPKYLHQGGVCGHVEDVVVREEYRHLGVGAKLVEHLVEVARSSRLYKLTLSCRPELTPFYTRCGFEQTEVTMSRYLCDSSSAGTTEGSPRTSSSKSSGSAD